MQIPAWLQALFRVDDSLLDQQFVLTDEVAEDSNDPSKANPSAGAGEEKGKEAGESAGQSDREKRGDGQGHPGAEDGNPAEGGNSRTQTGDSTGREEGRGVRPIRPVAMEAYLQQAGQKSTEGLKQSSGADEKLPVQLQEVKRQLAALFHLPENKDVIVREFAVGHRHWPALAVFLDGMSDKMVINTHILQPLMFLSEVAEDDASRRMESITEALLPGNQIEIVNAWHDVVTGVIAGSTVVFVEGCTEAVVVETKGWEHRSVSQPAAEQVVRGPHNAFTENFRANTGLVRAFLRSEHLVTEMLSVGRLGKTDVAVMYIEGLTNKSLVEEVKRRIKNIDVDYVADSGTLEQFIEDNPGSLIPQVLATERPDRIAHMLSEGHVAIFVGQSPFVLAVPVVLWTMVQSPEDAFLRFPFGSFGRIIRWVALLVAFLLPAGYVAITNYHSEMIPTDLMLAIAASRERVPFAVITEVLMMEFAIELIREAGIRIPSAIGPTIGIVGALIIGQAAVQAGLVSPLLVIVVAVTALCSFAIPNYELSYAVRILRFIFLVCAAFFGFYAIALLMCMLLVRLAVMKSFGVPILSPITPTTPSSRDVLVRGPVYAMNQRPVYLRTQTQWRQQPMTRPWSAFTRKTARRNLFRRKEDQ
ncbi:spore germination protein [Alicyclobacillus herbarius]|uniref:spore germination protein n=1 Tax=Alicyclobacillus herbarius TaxID=122960 RepID=UPI0004274374|nr:spore germination protein [Alicyclobacillus herbarius]